MKFLSHVPAHEVILFRSMVSFAMSFAYIKRNNIPLFGKNKKILILRGVFGVMALTMYFVTLQKIPLASATTIQYLSPIFGTIAAFLILKEKVYPWQWILFAVSFVGAALVKGFDPRVDLLYFFLGLGSALFSGLAYTCVRMLKDSDHPYVIVMYFPMLAIPIMIVWCIFDWYMPQGWEWILLILVGIFTQIAQVNMTKALQLERLSVISSMKYLGVGFALMYGYLFFGETYDWQAMLGILLVLTGVLLNVFLKFFLKSFNK
ncbi:MAG: DMT family transporter [Chitinophagales bacterium]